MVSLPALNVGSGAACSKVSRSSALPLVT